MYVPIVNFKDSELPECYLMLVTDYDNHDLYLCNDNIHRCYLIKSATEDNFYLIERMVNIFTRLFDLPKDVVHIIGRCYDE